MTRSADTTTGVAAPALPALPALAADDRAELTDLVSRLGAALDEHRFDVLAGLFTADATARTPGGTAEGRDAVVAQATRNHVGYERLHHVMTNVLVEPAHDAADGVRSARIRANLTAHFAHADGVPVQVLGAVYRFGAQKTDAGWRFTELQVAPVWRTAAA
ncbi:nuclear transport factor 2 family protein [Agromyces aureus]|uniref:SnoaL-like domain-containing protein n=1 Tax=Agromyces aureus TaxID=453304 RepID=A0A191WJD8_9MICO|nr:nuclear transport factor 2 family protein [Agromyces aureus]ANJ28440.1 hypothetical protein ATC03_18825 [Agromyces aureus]